MFENYRDIVNIDELMEMLGIGRNKAYELLRSGQIKHKVIGKKYKIPKKYVIEYLEV